MRRLREVIKQRKPFASLEQEVFLEVLRTGHALVHDLVELLKPYGLTQPQYNVLRILRGAGETGLPTLEIAVRMLEQAPGVTRLLDRLDAKSLVRRERCPSDRRQVLCWITPAGQELLAVLDPVVEAADAAVVSALATPERQTLLRLLDRVRASLQR